MGGMLRDEWESFERAVLQGAPAVQRWEMRRAFYGGAWAMLCKFQAIGEPDVSEEEGVDKIQGFMDECREFNEQIKKGEA